MNTIYCTRSLLGLAAVASLGVSTSAIAKDGEVLAANGDGLTLESGDLVLNLGGRLHFDALTYDDGTDSDSTADFRRARIEFSARWGDTIRVRVDREFAGVDGWRNVYAAVQPVKDVLITGGNFTVPFSMEDQQSSNRITFVERSLANTLAPGFGLGGGMRVAQDNWTLSGGYFTDALDDAEGRSRKRGDGFAMRATFAPIRENGQFLHFGAAYEHRSFDLGELPSFSASPGSNLAPNLIGSGTIAEASKLDNYGAEMAYARGPVQVQTQFIASRVDRASLSTLDFGGWYAQASWMVTGEDYGYSRSNGNPNGPRLNRKKGAVELAARYSELDLDDPSLDRGDASSLTLGATWYLNETIRMLANYVHSETSHSQISPNTSGDLGVVRFQIAF